MIRTKAAAHACWCWTGSGDSEYVKILKGIVATGWRGSDVVVFVKSVVVKRIGAVSPAARATASVVPVTIPPSVVGRTTRSTVRHFETPSAWLACRSDCGTRASTSCAERETSGSMMIASAIDAMNALCLNRMTSSA